MPRRRRDDDDDDSDEGEEIRCKREAPEHDGTEEGHKAWWVQHAAWITTEGYDDEILGKIDESKYPRRTTQETLGADDPRGPEGTVLEAITWQ